MRKSSIWLNFSHNWDYSKVHVLFLYLNKGMRINKCMTNSTFEKSFLKIESLFDHQSQTHIFTF